MTPNLPHRYRFIAQNGLTGESGQYKGDISWVVEGLYSNSNGPVFQRALGRWISSIGEIDTLRFDGDGAGTLSSGVLNLMNLESTPRVVCSEFSPKLQEILRRKGHCDSIIDDGLIPEKDGGTAVVIANQFLDALPFTVMRRLYPSGALQELAVGHNGVPYYENIPNCQLDDSSCGNVDPASGVFAYSPAKSNYIRNILSRVGTTYLAIIDWGFAKTESQYLQDMLAGNLFHSSTPSSLLRRLAIESGANVVFSDMITTWKHMDYREGELEVDLYRSLILTIIKCERDTKTRHQTCEPEEQNGS